MRTFGARAAVSPSGSRCDTAPWRAGSDTNWASFDADVRAAAAALIELGVGEQRRVGIFSANRPEWTLADLGTLSARAVPVPIYPTNTVEQAAYIVRDAEVDVLFVAGREPLEKAREMAAGGRPLTLVSFDEPTTAADDAGRCVLPLPRAGTAAPAAPPRSRRAWRGRRPTTC